MSESNLARVRKRKPVGQRHASYTAKARADMVEDESNPVNPEPGGHFHSPQRDELSEDWCPTNPNAPVILPTVLDKRVRPLSAEARRTLGDHIGHRKRLKPRLAKVRAQLTNLPSHEKYLAVEVAADFATASLMADASARLLAETPSGAWYWKYIAQLWRTSQKIKAERENRLCWWLQRAGSPTSPMDLL